MVYDWKINMPIKAQDAGEHIERLEAQYGQVTPKIILDSARSEDSLFHPCFEWNDMVAAEKYREVQAGGIIRNLVVCVGSEEEPTQVRAFVNVRIESESTFLSVTKVLQDDDLRAQLLATAQRELGAFRDKYANLTELSSVLTAIDNLEVERA